MLETVKQSILEAKDSRTTFNELYVHHIMEVQDANLEAEFATLSRMNANLDIKQIDHLLAITNSELRHINVKQ